MRNIFKKNQIIITALAIMIVIAGYLSFTNRDAAKDANTVEAVNPDSEDYDAYTELEGVDVATTTDTNNTTGTTDNTTTGTNDTTNTTDTTNDTITDNNATDNTTTLDDTNAETTGTDKEDATIEDQADELGDISDDEILASAKDVADNGELKDEPGEAVLANAAIDAGYFISSKLDREQLRAKSKESYMQIIQSDKLSEAAKKDAVNKMIELTEIAEKEDATELLLEAKGFDGSVVYISDGEVEVVVNATNLSDQQLAIIESVVKDKTDITAEHIHINPVVATE